MHLLVTGGAGFIGANFIELALARGYAVTNLDALTYAANLSNCSSFNGHQDYTFVEGSIIDAALVEQVIGSTGIEAVINFAAESHVDRSISAARAFAETNVLGTVTLLEAALNHKVQTFLQISTDEVYGSLGNSGMFTLDSPIRPSSPYSASKAAADHMALSFYHTHRLDVRITRCTNNFGKYQHPEKFIPTVITRALNGEPIPIYGDGKYIRDWIFVNDHCEGILAALENGVAGETYLFGGSQEIDNNSLVATLLAAVEEQTGLSDLGRLISNVKDRPGHDRRYAIDWSHSELQLGWRPRADFEQVLRETVDWYLENRNWWTA